MNIPQQEALQPEAASLRPQLIEGGLAVDDRGEVSFVNGFCFLATKRFYIVANHTAGLIRAWHGHRYESKHVMVLQGAAVVAAVSIDDWQRPSPASEVYRFVLSDHKPSVLHIPCGYANGFMSLTSGTRLIFFSSATLDESRSDDVRFEARYWNPWEITER